MHEYFFEARGIYYRTNDFSPTRETLVFVHGVSGSSSAWKHYEEKFKDGYNILTFDLRGHGKSRKQKGYEAYAIERFADDLAALLAHLRIQRMTLISHSFGVLIALEFMRTHAAIVERAVFLSPSYNVRQGMLPRIVGALLWLVRPFAIFPQAPTPGRHIDYDAQYPTTSDWDITRMIDEVRNTGFRIYCYCSQQALHVDYADVVRTIMVPTLLVHGKRDTIFPHENSIEMHTMIAGSEIALIDGADHITVTRYFDEVASVIERFLARTARNHNAHETI